MNAHGIPLKEILGSALIMEQVKVKGVGGLKQIADEHAARETKARDIPAVIHIVHRKGDTTIDITLSDVDEMSEALRAIGYTRKSLLAQIKDRIWLS